MRQIANNTFNDGMLMDMQPLTTPNSVLTDCLNGTLITYDGNEFVLQSDDGNAAIDGCKLPKDFIPIGMKEYGGIVYIVSQNPFTGECEIGSFPSPERTIFKSTEIDKAPQTVLQTSDLYIDESKNNGIENTIIKLDFVENDRDEKQLLRPGDKFAIFIDDGSNSAMDNFRSLLELYENGILSERRLFKFKLLRISDDGITEPIEDIVPKFNTDGTFYYTKSQIQNKDSSEGLFAVYNNKVNGYLMLVLELEQVDEFDLNIENIEGIEGSKDSSGNFTLFKFDIVSTSKADCKNNVTGLEITVDDEKPQDQEVSSDYKETWKVPSGLFNTNNVIVGKNKTICTATISDKNINEDIKLKIRPYSPFGFFANLEYNNVVNYSKLTSAKESSVWKYYLDESLDPEITPDKVKITYDFFVRGTKNGRNKLDAIYIEFYDVISDTSLFYPISSVSDSKTITINCFNGQNPDIKSSTGGLDPTIIKNDKKYYLLIDKNKSGEYNECLKDLDEGNAGYTNLDILANTDLGYNTVKNIPFVYKLDSLFTTSENRYDNLGIGLNTSNTKLRKNNFYIAAIVGLDYYIDSITEKLTCKKYVCYNFLWTTGVFNKYWPLSGGSNDNFNFLQLPNYVDIELEYTSNWLDTTESAELLLTSDNPRYSYQSYINNYYKNDSEEESRKRSFNTRILVSGNVSRTYQTYVKPNSQVLKGYGDIEGTLNYSTTPSSIDLEKDIDYSVSEDNSSVLSTDSVINSLNITGKNGEPSYKFDTGFKVTINTSSNRKIECDGIFEELECFQTGFKSLEENKGYTIDELVSPYVIRIIGFGTNGSNYIYIDNRSNLSVPSADDLWDHIGDDYHADLGYLIGGSSSTTIVPSEAIKEISSRLGNYQFAFVQCLGYGNSHGWADPIVTNGVKTSSVNTKKKYSSSNNTSLANQFLFLLYTGKNYDSLLSQYNYPFAFLRKYQSNISDSTASETFRNVKSALINGLNKGLQVQFSEKVLTPITIPNVGTVLRHGSFDSLFNINKTITTAQMVNYTIKTKYKGKEQLLNSSFYDSVKNSLPEEIENIGVIFSDNYIYNNQNFPLINDSKEIIYKDSYIISKNKFTLKKEQGEYTIDNIIYSLSDLSEAIGEGTSVDSSKLYYNDKDLSLFFQDGKIQGDGFRYSSRNAFTMEVAHLKDSNGAIKYMSMAPINSNSSGLGQAIEDSLSNFTNSLLSGYPISAK